MRPPSRSKTGLRSSAPRTAISSIRRQVTSSSVQVGLAATISPIRPRQRSSSLVSTSPTIVGFVVAPVAPWAIAYSSSATEQESFQKSVAVVDTVRRRGLATPPSSRAARGAATVAPGWSAMVREWERHSVIAYDWALQRERRKHTTPFREREADAAHGPPGGRSQLRRLVPGRGPRSPAAERRARAGNRRRAAGRVMKTIRLTTAEAIVRYLVAQRTVLDGEEAPLFAGAFAILGHGNALGLGQALAAAHDALPTYRAQNEQGMALAGIGYAKAMRRRQIMVATSSIGPGALNMVTAAGVAHANRLPILLLSGDTFQSRIPDPVLQQIERFDNPAATVNDAFRAVTRYWDRLTRPEQVAQSLPAAIETMLDPADCGPAFIGLPQDVQAEAYDFPLRLFEPRLHELRRLRPDRRELAAAAAALLGARKPLVVAGGGVHYSLAEDELARFAAAHGLPVVETVAGKSSLRFDHPCYVGPIGVTGSDQANRLAAEADVVLAAGTRLQDFTTGSWTVFGNEELRLIGLNAARFDATKHRSLPLVADVREGLAELGAALGPWQADAGWRAQAAAEAGDFRRFVDSVARPDRSPGRLPSYAEVVGAVNGAATADDYVLTAAGGLPGELNVGWRSLGPATFDCEYGFSCMGYEIAGAWGARMARAGGEVFCLVGDGSYLMLNSELYSSVLSGHRLIVVLCDNGGFAVIERLQLAHGAESFATMLEGAPAVDWVAHAQALGCRAEAVDDVEGLAEAIARARGADRTTVIAIRTAPAEWTPGGAFWEVGVPEQSERAEVGAAREAVLAGKQGQRVGW